MVGSLLPGQRSGCTVVLVLHVHSALLVFESKPKHDLYSVEPYQLYLITEHAFRRAQMLNWYIFRK